MRSEQLTVVYKLDTLGVAHALQGIEGVLRKYQIRLDGFRVYGKPMDFPNAIRDIRKPHFNVTGCGFEFRLSPVRNHQLDFFQVKTTHECKTSWVDWSAPFIGESNFVMAWLADSEYDHWQNAKDPLQYTAVGKSYAHLPMKSSGLPYPLEQKIIDTSANPGRWRLCDGYYEAVGAVMWLGEPFWQLTGADKTGVENARWLRASKPVPSVTCLQAANECFTTADGASGELQGKLRSLLFPAVK